MSGMRTEEQLLYMPSLAMQERMLQRDLHPTVKIHKKKRTKDVTIKLQYTREPDRASAVAKMMGIPINDVPEQEAVDECWQSLINHMDYLYKEDEESYKDMEEYD